MDKYKYMRDGLDDKFGFLSLQDKILEIMVFIDKLCQKNKIDYCLMGGSALGAKRHGGFIPWDDDLDIFMFPEDYAHFRSLFDDSNNLGRYHLQEWGAIDGYITLSKVRMDGTAYFEESLKNWDIHHGIYVDILILNKCSNNVFGRLRQFFWSKYILMKGLAEKGYNRKKGLVNVALKIMKLFPEYHLVSHGYKCVYKYEKLSKYSYYCYFFGRAVYKNAIYKREWFDQKEYVQFEKVLLRVPKNLEDFLSARFGDWRIIPSQETIKLMQHAESWSVDKDFRSLRPDITFTFKDEKRLMG